MCFLPLLSGRTTRRSVLISIAFYSFSHSNLLVDVVKGQRACREWPEWRSLPEFGDICRLVETLPDGR
ncbi:MAG: hypothetical protein M3R07_03465, partial [Gemmatimonadota bacterium]|nr:hypothetical protein [Gemmatimonadota bacterium]